jgi:hypothetical protein
LNQDLPSLANSVRLHRSEDEFLLFLPDPKDHQRIAGLKSKSWDEHRNCWILPRTDDVWREIREEFDAELRYQVKIESIRRERITSYLTDIREGDLANAILRLRLTDNELREQLRYVYRENKALRRRIENLTVQNTQANELLESWSRTQKKYDAKGSQSVDRFVGVAKKLSKELQEVTDKLSASQMEVASLRQRLRKLGA